MLGYAYSNGEWAKVYRMLPNGQKIRWLDYDNNNPEHSGRPADPVGGRINYTPAEDVDWDNIPPRPWLAGTRLLRGYVTLLTGPGGVGKTALTMTTALSYALGRNLLDPSNTNRHWKLHGGRLRTYIYGLEDDLDEMKRRIKAVMNFHGVHPSETQGFLALGDGSVNPLILAISEAGRKLVRTAIVDTLIAHLLRHAIDVLILDPFVKTHNCNENDNGEMDFVMVILKEVAIRARCAIWLIHHSGKGGTTMDPHGGRGASAIPAAGRVNETLSAATVKDHDAFGFGRDVVRLEATKANMSPIGEDDIQWLRLSGCAVGNGDFVQVIELIDGKDQTERMDAVLFDGICDAVRAAPEGGSGMWVSTKSATNWIGHAIRAGGVGTDQRASSLAQAWQKLGLLIPDAEAKDGRKRKIMTALKLNEVMAAKHRRERWGD